MRGIRKIREILEELICLWVLLSRSDSVETLTDVLEKSRTLSFVWKPLHFAFRIRTRIFPIRKLRNPETWHDYIQVRSPERITSRE